MYDKKLVFDKTKSVLIAETDLNLAAQIKEQFISMDYMVYPVISSGEELIAQALLLTPSLIIANTILNGQLDGIEAISRLEEAANINYIFISACEEQRQLIASYFLHPLNIIRIPVNFNNLINFISSCNLEPV